MGWSGSTTFGNRAVRDMSYLDSNHAVLITGTDGRLRSVSSSVKGSELHKAVANVDYVGAPQLKRSTLIPFALAVLVLLDYSRSRVQ